MYDGFFKTGLGDTQSFRYFARFSLCMVTRSRSSQQWYTSTQVGFLDMTEPRPQCRKKKQALRDIEAKGITLEKAFELGAEETIIERQLGFLPTNVHSIAARAESGEPTVLKLYPLAVSLKGARAGNTDRQPFPTMYWLSCPALKAAVSQLENQGLVTEWERRLQADPELVAEMKAAHLSYAEERWAMLTAADLDVIRRRGWELSLGRTVGVAGISKPGTIKCLHTHFAHFLATGQNVVGRWVRDALNGGLHIQQSGRGDNESNLVPKDSLPDQGGDR